MDNLPPTCLYCARSEHSTPLLSIRYRGTEYWICPQHLPILIHHPEELADKLPGLLASQPGEAS